MKKKKMLSKMGVGGGEEKHDNEITNMGVEHGFENSWNDPRQKKKLLTKGKQN